MKSISAAFARTFVRTFTLVAALCGVVSAQAQTTQINTDYLMTVHIPTERKAVDNNLVVVNILPGGWVKGPKISGKILPPGGDWIRVMPSGALRLDVRLTIETDDGALIYMTYGGVVVGSKETSEALARGETDLRHQENLIAEAERLHLSNAEFDNMVAQAIDEHRKLMAEQEVKLGHLMLDTRAHPELAADQFRIMVAQLALLVKAADRAALEAALATGEPGAERHARLLTLLLEDPARK